MASPTFAVSTVGLNISTDGTLTIAGTSTHNGNMVIGNATTDTLALTSRVSGDISFLNGVDHSIIVDAAEVAGGVGGDFLLLSGDGGASDGAVASAGGGNLALLSGNGGDGSGAQAGSNGGALTLTSGNGGAGVGGLIGGRGGAIQIATGQGFDGEEGGSMTIDTGVGGVGGSGGDLAITIGDGGTGASGGDFNVTGSDGGNSDGVVSASNAGDIGLFGGTGGAGFGSGGTEFGSLGGAINILAGAGGAGVGGVDGGNGGNLQIDAGEGTDGGTNGTATFGAVRASAITVGNTNSVTTFNGAVLHTPDPRTIATNGGGTPAALTLTPLSGFVKITCNDPDGCDITMSETGTVTDGQVVTIVSIGTNAVNFADTAGVTELAGAFAMGQFDSLTLRYVGTRWVEMSRSNN